MDNSDVKIVATHPKVSRVVRHDVLTIAHCGFCFISWSYRETAEVLNDGAVHEGLGFGYTTSP